MTTALDGRPFRTVMVTGTNGKTTVTSLIAAIVAASGETSARVTTVGSFVGDRLIAEEPTLEAFQAFLAESARAGVKTLAVEASSAALAEGFAHRFPPDVGVFTQLSRDHIDYHTTIEHYLASKAQLFINLKEGGVAVLNATDGASRLLADVARASARRVGFAVKGEATLPPIKVEATPGVPVALAGAGFTVHRGGTRVELGPSELADRLGGSLELGLFGEAMVENALAAAVAADALGYPAQAIRAALATFAGVPGRFQIVGEEPLVVVDYAHTPDALRKTLVTARALLPERGHLWCVFGCGGDRDTGKRGPMGRAAGNNADHVVVTTDNPRTEDPDLIAYMVLKGAKERRAEVSLIRDRRAAIEHAVTQADARDVVLIAGKGHEKTQVFASGPVPFDDVEVAREAIRSRSRAVGSPSVTGQ